jgi:hypothetical protein
MTGLSGASAVLGTRHGKERVIAPALEKLGIDVEVLPALDTDRFGTFSREIPRVAPPRETARAKALAAIEEHGRATIGVASEGSFGPHPAVPFVPGGVELVILVDVAADIELLGTDVTMETNFRAEDVGSVEEAFGFAARVSFPSHGLIVMPYRDGAPDARCVVKGIVDARALEDAVRQAMRAGRAWIETDMRAHVNPTRMQSIERAALALASAALSACPVCARPGYVVVERMRGLPCSDCGLPTAKARAEVLACAGCRRREERPLGRAAASPAECDGCNP